MKTKESRTIHLDPNSELARALSSSNNESVYLDSNGKRFRVIRVEDDPWADYDPEKVRAALEKVAGLLSPEEGDRIIENIYRGREEGTRPIDRP